MKNFYNSIKHEIYIMKVENNKKMIFKIYYWEFKLNSFTFYLITIKKFKNSMIVYILYNVHTIIQRLFD
jgi:hypothetical protein